jgi:cyclic beta-1,2-glucan synthetase
MDIMQNSWLLYQTIACRVWARSAFYQASGAYGYRDQLQDTMTVAFNNPAWTRQHLLRAASRQFLEGDVQHWWLPSETDAGRGVRTRFSDDALWLAYVTAYYIRITGDAGVLDEEVPFLQGPVLKDDEHEAFFLPQKSDHTATLFEHCAMAIDRSLKTGAHGISLFGGGDWNDGMNRVGAKGQGESVWLAWFLLTVLKDFSIHAEVKDASRVANWQQHAAELKAALERDGWDGEWYRRGYYDDGTPLGSAGSAECRIDSIAQSWSVISGAGDVERQARGMRAVEQYLVKHDDGLALLFTPPFDHTNMDPGYIKGYPPGIRENGGQYTHAAIWSVIAFNTLGEGDKAFALYSMLNPIHHASSRAASYTYKVEPYVIAADIYANPQHMGRGGWTWYTGSSGWMYRAGLESILGFYLEGDRLRIDPCIPKNWPGFEIAYRYKSTLYTIKVENRAGVNRGVVGIKLDGQEIGKVPIPLKDDGGKHVVQVVMGIAA